MRRPSLLPAPPGQADGPPTHVEVVDAQPPAASASELRDAAAATDGTGVQTPRAEQEAQPPIRVRDVWRAARAHRRALRAEVRRFTGRQRRRRALWIGAAASLAVLVAGTFGAAYSPLFAVQDIQVVGTHTLSASGVEKALSGQLGRPFPLVDDSAVKAALVRFPLVESYTLEARPPHELVVRIVERVPVGVVHDAAGYTVVDAAGVALSTTATPPAGEPTISVTGGVDSDAFRSLGEVMRALPASIRAQVTAATATTPDDVTLRLGATTVVWGSADQSAYKALVLERTMQAHGSKNVSQYDVSAPSAVVIG